MFRQEGEIFGGVSGEMTISAGQDWCPAVGSEEWLRCCRSFFGIMVILGKI